MKKIILNLKYYFTTLILFNFDRKFIKLKEAIKKDKPKNDASKVFILSYVNAIKYAEKKDKINNLLK